MNKLAWIRNGTPHTLTGAGDTMTISDLTAKKFNQILVHALQSGAINTKLTFNNNTTNVYTYRQTENGGVDNTINTQPRIPFADNGVNNVDRFGVAYVCSISGQEKLAIIHTCDRNGAGASSAPNRIERVGKYVPSPDADITRVDVTNDEAGADYAIGSNLTAMGTD